MIAMHSSTMSTMVGTPTLESPAPHMCRSLFERTAKSTLWQIRHWGGEAHSNP